MSTPQWLLEHCARLNEDDAQLENLNLNLRRLNLDWMNLLTKALCGNQSLKVLNLVASIVTPNAETVVCQVLPTTKLEKLHLSYNHISDIGASSLGQALQSTIHLKEIYLDFNNIHQEGAIKLAEGLAVNASGLEMLQLDCNHIGDGGAAAFGKLLGTSKSLRRLNLGRNHITTAGAMAIVEGLRENFSVVELNLDGNTEICPHVLNHVEYLVLANRYGRYLLRHEDHLSIAFWSHLLGRVSDQSTMIYFFLTSKPDLCKML